MIQFELDNDFTYYNNIKFLKLENNNNYSNKEENNDSSKPKENIPVNESNSSKEDTIQEINIGYPLDTAEFKKLKDKSKRKMDIDDDDNVTEDENVSKEDEN